MFEISFPIPDQLTYFRPYYISVAGRNSLIYAFPKNICTMWNANSIAKDLNSFHHVYFLRRYL